MKRTMHGVLTTLTASLAFAVTTWLTPADALPSIPNLLNSGGGGTLKLADVIHPSDYTLQRSLNTSTGLSDVIVRWKDTSPADTSTLIERANSAGTSQEPAGERGFRRSAGESLPKRMIHSIMSDPPRSPRTSTTPSSCSGRTRMRSSWRADTRFCRP